MSKQKHLKKYLKNNFGKWIIIGMLTLIGVAAHINLYALNEAYDSTKLNTRIGKENIREKGKDNLVIKGNSGGRRIIKPIEEIALCSLDDVVCPNEKVIREITAYNLGDPSQTDDDPCIMASGLNGCELLEKGIKICAANFVPFHTKLNIDNFGECEVLDRMNSRYQNRVDVGMRLDEVERALNFGKQNLAVAIINN
jgi:3D (Asp-Asp-Asp) domain-containing protein